MKSLLGYRRRAILIRASVLCSSERRNICFLWLLLLVCRLIGASIATAAPSIWIARVNLLLVAVGRFRSGSSGGKLVLILLFVVIESERLRGGRCLLLRGLVSGVI
jgi:hypothetical protein